jgi:hypothetical protein
VIAGTVDAVEWLTAIDAHPDTFDIDLTVAVALVNGDSAEGIEKRRADDSVMELVCLGFLDVAAHIPCDCGDRYCPPECGDLLLSFRMP